MKTNNSGNFSVNSRWAIRPLVSEEVYTDREEHLEYLYNAAIDAATRRTMSTVLLGQRRMGKTEIFKCVVRQAAKQKKPIISEKILNEILAVDLSSGFIWAELNDQVTKWIERINEYGITKWILYLSALEEGDRLDLDRIQKELADREGNLMALLKKQNI